LFFHQWVGLHIGGTETHIKELACRFAKRGHEVHIITSKGDKLEDYESLMKVWYISRNWREAPFPRSFRQDSLLPLYMFVFGTKALVKFCALWFAGVRFDVASVHWTPEAILMRFLRPLLKLPYVFVLEGYTDHEAKWARYADLQIAISKDIVDRCFMNYGYKPVLIPIGIDAEKYDVDGTRIRTVFCKNNEKLIVTVCRLDPRKDIPTLISAARLVCEKDDNVKFIVVGDGPDRQKIEQMIQTLNLSDKVRVVRKVPVTPDFYKAGDLFVLPSLYEGLGIVFLEAMSARLPIIATSVGAIPEILGDVGVLIPPRRPELLAEKILEVIYDDKLLKKMVEKGLNRLERYDWQKLIVKYEKAYLSVTNFASKRDSHASPKVFC
jgi:glycosyltransferase involved in cell wall biosynthesis